MTPIKSKTRITRKNKEYEVCFPKLSTVLSICFYRIENFFLTNGIQVRIGPDITGWNDSTENVDVIFN